MRGFEFIPNGVDDVPLALMIAIGPFIDEVTVLRVEMNRVWIFSGGRNRRPDGTLREFLRSLGAS